MINNNYKEIEMEKKETKRFYGFQFIDGRETTTGYINHRTKRLSKAGFEQVFTDKISRDDWVAEGCDSIGGRIAVTKLQLREFFAGMSMQEFDEMMEMWG